MSNKPSLTRLTVPSLVSRKIVHLILTAGLVTGLLVVASTVLPTPKEALVSEAVGQSQVAVPSHNLRFTVYPEGIYPATATVHKGLISISIEDLAGANGGILVERVGDRGPELVGIVQRFERHWRGRSSVSLTPGIYTLRVAGKPTNEARLTVKP